MHSWHLHHTSTMTHKPRYFWYLLTKSQVYHFETYAPCMLCNYLQHILTIFLWIEVLFGEFYRLSVEVMRAVGQGGGRGCTLLYSLRLWPERLQAVAPGCSHFAPATWIHRHSDPWLTLQTALSSHNKYCTIVSCTFASCLHHSGKPAQPKPAHCCLTLPAPVWKKNNNASDCMLCSVPYLPCLWPVFSFLKPSHCYYA